MTPIKSVTGDACEQLPQPLWCRAEAYQLFAQQMDALASDEGFEQAAIAIAMHAFDDLQPVRTVQRLDDLACRVQQRVRGSRTPVVLAHLHDVLFEEEHYGAEGYNWRCPLFGYFPTAVELKTGTVPVLCLIYKAVARRLGVRVVGLNVLPRFMVAVLGNDGVYVIDVATRGRLVAVDELASMVPIPAVRRRCGHRLAVTDLPCATHRQWLSQMLAHLQHVFACGGFHEDLAAVTELQDLLTFSES